jgi:S-DNA-T family DNA segregation ATPase FtsK/SpoIIIE
MLAGIVLIVATLLLALALATYQPTDPSLNTAAAGPVQNLAGPTGAYASDLFLSLMGPPVVLLLPVLLIIGLRLARGAEAGRWLRALLLSMLGIVLIGPRRHC